MNLLLPIAGMGTRVKDHYGTIKPLIKVKGKTLIEYVIDNIYDKDAHYIFVVQRQHCVDYQLDEYLQTFVGKHGNKCSIIQIDGLTSGAAVTCLKAIDLINNDTPLLLANSDQYVQYLSTKTLFKQMEIDRADAGIIVFEDTSPKWSFVKLNNFGQVCRVVEKSPISNLATIGYYGFLKGSDFVRCANKMIAEDFRVNGEYYSAVTLDYLCKDGGIVKAYYSNKCFGTGTVQDIIEFEKYLNAI